jgi:hypothetical protein
MGQQPTGPILQYAIPTLEVSTLEWVAYHAVRAVPFIFGLMWLGSTGVVLLEYRVGANDPDQVRTFWSVTAQVFMQLTIGLLLIYPNSWSQRTVYFWVRFVLLCVLLGLMGGVPVYAWMAGNLTPGTASAGVVFSLATLPAPLALLWSRRICRRRTGFVL